MADLNLYSVNWQDGMLLTQQHLREQERYFEELLRWHAINIGDQYGLVRKSTDGNPALSLQPTVSGMRVRVEVTRCQAVTPNGYVIDVTESTSQPVIAEIDNPPDPLSVYVSVDIESKNEVGDPIADEDLPRMPYLGRAYTLHLGAAPNLPRGQVLKIAELTLAGDTAAHSKSYFPPCMALDADDRLLDRAKDYKNRLENLLSLTTRAYLAISAEGALGGASTKLQNEFRTTIYHFAYHLSSTLDDYVVGRNAVHPVELVRFFKKLFRSFTTLLNLHPGLKDYLNERFFTKEMNTDVTRFMSSVDGFLLSDYHHEDLGGQIKTIDGFLAALRGIAGFLAQTKAEDVGEQAVATETLTYQAKTYRFVEYGGSRLDQMGELSYLTIDIPKAMPVGDTVVLINKDLLSIDEWKNIRVRLGMNEARGLGETDPVEVDTTSFGNKVALRPQDMLKMPSVNQMTLILQGVPQMDRLAKLGKMDLIVYAL